MEYQDTPDGNKTQFLDNLNKEKEIVMNTVMLLPIITTIYVLY